jgi:hypothetical protein
MGIGDSTNSNFNKIYDPTYYSRLTLKNSDSKRLSISYRSGLMILEIGKSIGSGDSFKVETEETIYLSPMKAHILTNQINSFIEYKKAGNIDPKKAFGVNAGMGEKVTYIAFSADTDGSNVITIGKFDGKGVIVESASFRMSIDFNYALNWDDLAANNLTKVFDNDAEIIMLRNAIADFSRSMSGAYGYSAFDINRYEQNKANKRIDQIFDALGIERQNYGGNKSFSQNNFLNNTSSKSTSYEEIEDLLA